jgi:hypothetical protein
MLPWQRNTTWKRQTLVWHLSLVDNSLRFGTNKADNDCQVDTLSKRTEYETFTLYSSPKEDNIADDDDDNTITLMRRIWLWLSTMRQTLRYHERPEPPRYKTECDQNDKETHTHNGLALAVIPETDIWPWTPLGMGYARCKTFPQPQNLTKLI